MKVINAWSPTRARERINDKGIKEVVFWPGDIILSHNVEGKRKYKIVSGRDEFHWYFLTDNTELARITLKGMGFYFDVDGEYLKIYHKKYKFKDPAFIDRIKFLHDKGIQTYEADLGPMKRYMIDNKLEIEDYENVRLWFFDIETDDSTGPIEYIKHGFYEEINAKDQILSVAFVNRKGDTHYFTDKNEKKLLKQVCAFMESEVDMIVGWNSKEFDLPYLQKRCKVNDVDGWYFWNVLHEDMMKRSQYFYSKDPVSRQEITSFSLEFFSQYFLKEGKIKHTEKVKELFDNFPDRLKEYNIQDCHLLRKLEDQLGIIRQTYQMFQICGCVAQNWSMVKNLDNFLLKAAISRGIHWPTNPSYLKGWEGNDEMGEVYLGAFVIDPIPGAYEDVYDLDFKSLYPNIIRSFNISPETYVGKEPKDNTIFTPGVVIDDKRRGYAVYNKEIGIVPKEITLLLDEREKIRKEQKKVDKSSVAWRDLNVKQLVVKELANSIYGVIGNKYFRGFNIDMAESITSTGQYLIKHLTELYEAKGRRVIYGDTDSIFVRLADGESIDKVLEDTNKHLSHHIKTKFGVTESTIQLNLDKKFDKFFIEAKKKYAGEIDGKVTMVGLEAIKRDTIPITIDFQKLILRNVLDKIPFDVVKKFVHEQRRQILEDDLDPLRLALHKRLQKDAKDYQGKSEKKYTAPIQVRVALAMKDKSGDKTDFTKAGSIISFIITKDAGTTNSLEAIHISEFDGHWDRDYYWNNQVFPPICRMLEIAYPEVDWGKYFVWRHTPTALKRFDKKGITPPSEVLEP